MPSASPSETASGNPARPIRRVAIVFAGGPAPAANAVISTAAASFLRHGIEVLGILHGYAHLVEFGDDHPMQEGRDYIVLDQSRLKRDAEHARDHHRQFAYQPRQGRVEPHAPRRPRAHAKLLRTVHRALDSLGVDALVSIGGDDTLKTANKFQRFQEFLPAGSRRISVVHVPKTIDNDYRGIDFTFGYFTAVEFLASEIRNLLADAESGRMYFLVETMGRSAGWLAYGAAIAGEASKVISVEDLDDHLMTEETLTDPKSGHTTTRRVLEVEKLVGEIVHVMLAREKEGKQFGAIVIAEGLAQYLPSSYLEGAKFDEHGHISLPQTELAKVLSKLVEAEYTKQTGSKRRVTGVQLGYEARCACRTPSTSSSAASSASARSAHWSRTGSTASWSRSPAS